MNDRHANKTISMLRMHKFKSMLACLLWSTVAAGCLDGRARVSPRATWQHELDMPHDDEFVDLVPHDVVFSAVEAHRDELAALGLDVGDTATLDDVLSGIGGVWAGLDATERETIAMLFGTMFEHGRAKVLDQLDRRLDDLTDDAYISLEVSDFVEHAPARATREVLAAFDAGNFHPELDAIIVRTLRASRVEVTIAVYIADVDRLLRDAGLELANPTAYVTGSVLRSVGARTPRPDEDLAPGTHDRIRFEDEFEVETGCVDGQPRLDWIDGYDIRLLGDRAVYPEPFGSAWLLTEPSGPADDGPADDGPAASWVVLDHQRDLLAVAGGPARCGVGVAGPADSFEGTDITPFVVGDGFTVELRLSGLHAFSRLELASRAQITLEIGD